MTLRSIAVLVILASAVLWGQTSAGSLARRQSVIATSNTDGAAAAERAKVVPNQRLQEMGATLAKMHVLLKQMRAKTAASSSKDPITKANLDMWELMVGQLDKQYEQVRLASRAREDLDARRGALYKQADEKAAAAAKSAREAAKAAAAARLPEGTPASAQTNAATTTPSSSPN